MSKRNKAIGDKLPDALVPPASENRSIVGDLINFRGMVYAPINEQGVVFLFGKVMEDLNMYVEEIKSGFPDCIARRFVGTGWRRVRLEFEFSSKNFKDHGHDPTACDIVICWSHDWTDCPLEVIELREIIKGLENWSIERPGAGKTDAKESLTAKEWFQKHRVREGIENLFEKMVEQLQSLNEEVFYKVGSSAVSIYCPERVMIYVYPRKAGIRLELFTGNEPLGEVKTLNSEGKPTKWGALTLQNQHDVARVLPWLSESMKRIKDAISRNENTSWMTKIENDVTGAVAKLEKDNGKPLPKRKRNPNHNCKPNGDR